MSESALLSKGPLADRIQKIEKDIEDIKAFLLAAGVEVEGTILVAEEPMSPVEVAAVEEVVTEVGEPQ